MAINVRTAAVLALLVAGGVAVGALTTGVLLPAADQPDEPSGSSSEARAISVELDDDSLANRSVEASVASAPDEVRPGDDLVIPVTVENSGTEPKTQRLSLHVDGTVVDNRSVVVATGSRTNATLAHAGVGDEVPTDVRVTVAPERETGTADEQASPTFDVAAETSRRGDGRFDASVSVENVGDARGETDVSIGGDGVDCTPSTVIAELEPGESRTFVVPCEADGNESAELVVDAGLDRHSVFVPATTDDADSEAHFEVAASEVYDPVAAGDPITVEATVENTGNASGTQDVALVVGNESVDSKAVTLEEGGNASVTLSYATTADDAGQLGLAVASDDDAAAESARVTTGPSLDVSIKDADERVLVDSQGQVDVEIENVGDEATTRDVPLIVDGRIDQTESVDLEPGESVNHTFYYYADRSDVGTMDVRVTSGTDSASTTVDVAEPSPQFEVDVESFDGPVEAGETLAVTATVANNGTKSGTQELELLVEDTVVDSQSVALEAGDDTTVSFSYETTAADAGVLEPTVISRDDFDWERVTVEESTSD